MDTFYTSHFQLPQQSALGTADLDLEIMRTAVSLEHGISENLTLGIEVPFLYYTPGFLDSFIQNYHKTLGFGNNSRELVENNGFSFELRDENGVGFDVDRNSFGLGDISLWGRLQLLEEGPGHPAVGLKLGGKAPTGDSSQGFGSGGWDLGFGMNLEKAFTERFLGYASFSFYIPGDLEEVPGWDAKPHFSATAALEWRAYDNWSAILQLNVGSPLFSTTEIPQLDRSPMEYTVGIVGRLTDALKIRFGILENLVDDSAADVSFFLGFSYLF